MQGDIPATTSDDENDYQNLLVERGGVNVMDGVVRLAQANVRQVARPSSAKPDTSGDQSSDEAETESDKHRR